MLNKPETDEDDYPLERKRSNTDTWWSDTIFGMSGPWWLKAGPLWALIAFLVYVVTQNMPTKASVDRLSDQIQIHVTDTSRQLQETREILRAICENTSKSEYQINTCRGLR